MGRTRPSPSPAEGEAPGRPRRRPAGAARAPRASALEIAIQSLARRPMTGAEIRALLRRRRCTEEEASAAVARLEELGYVDDSAYAATFAGSVARSRGWGPRRVRQELARRGVSPEALEKGLARASEEGLSPEENIGRALQRLRRRSGTPPTRAEQRRLRAGLLRRGYDSGAIEEALAGLGGEPEEGYGEGE